MDWIKEKSRKKDKNNKLSLTSKSSVLETKYR